MMENERKIKNIYKRNDENNANRTTIRIRREMGKYLWKSMRDVGEDTRDSKERYKRNVERNGWEANNEQLERRKKKENYDKTFLIIFSISIHNLWEFRTTED